MIWIESMDFVTEIYKLTAAYPKHEMFGLSSQTQRAAVSIPLNISEGSAKLSNKDFSGFLRFSLGSSRELETVLIIAKNLSYISEEDLTDKQIKITELQEMMTKFKDNLEK